MADNLSVTIAADTGGLTAAVAVANANLRGFQRELAKTAAAASKAGDSLSEELDAKLRTQGEAVAAAKGAVSSLGGELKKIESAAAAGGGALAQVESAAHGAAGGMGALSGELRHGVAILDEFSRGARGPMIGSLTAMARDSGLLGKAVAALQSPMGIAITAGLGLAAALYEVMRAALSAQSALTGVYNAAIVEGRNAQAAMVNAKGLAAEIEATGRIGSGSALPFAAALEKIPDLSERAKKSLAGIGDAWSRIQFGGDLGKAEAAIPKMFESISAMKALVNKNRLLTGKDYQDFSQAAVGGDTGSAADLLAKGIVARYSAAQSEIAAKAKETSKGVFAEMAAQKPGQTLPMPLGDRLAEPLKLPSHDEMLTNEYIAEGNKSYDERQGLLGKIAKLQDGIKKGTVADVPRANRAIKDYQEQADLLDRRMAKQGAAGTPSLMDQVRAQMHQAESVAAAHARSTAAARAAMQKADIGVLDKTLQNPKLSAQDRLSLQSELSQKQTEQSLSGLERGASGARGAKEAQQKSYEAFAAAEKLKVTEAGTDASQIGAIYDQWEAKAASVYGRDSTQFVSLEREKMTAVERAEREQTEAAERAQRAQTEAANKAYQAFAASEKLKVAEAKNDFDKIAAIYDAWEAHAAQVYGAGSAQVASVQREALSAQQKASAAAVEPWASSFDKVGDTLQGAAKQLIFSRPQGGARAVFGSAAKSIGGDAFDSISGGLTKTLGSTLFPGSKSIGAGLAGMLGIGKPGGMLGTGLGAVKSVTGAAGGLGKDATTTANTSALTALTTAVSANTTALSAASTTSAGSVVSSGASAVGGIGGFLSGIPVLGSLFGGGGAASSGVDYAMGLAAFARGGIVPSAAGGWVVPGASGGIPSLLHAREMVLPANLSQGVQRAIAGGSLGGGNTQGGDTHFHAHFHGPSDAPSVSRWFKDNMRANSGAIRDMFRSNALTPRTL